MENFKLVILLCLGVAVLAAGNKPNRQPKLIRPCDANNDTRCEAPDRPRKQLRTLKERRNQKLLNRPLLNLEAQYQLNCSELNANMIWLHDSAIFSQQMLHRRCGPFCEAQAAPELTCRGDILKVKFAFLAPSARASRKGFLKLMTGKDKCMGTLLTLASEDVDIPFLYPKPYRGGALTRMVKENQRI